MTPGTLPRGRHAMAFLKRLKSVNQGLSGWFEWISFAGLLLMMAVTCVDVVGTKLFQAPLFGSIDMVVLLQLLGVSFAGSITLVTDRHIRVDFFWNLLPRVARNLLDSLVHLLLFGFLASLVWRLFALGFSFQAGGEESATARIPLFPFIYSAAVACIPMCLVYFQQFLQSVLQVTRNEP